jgi:hypothetical protein
LLAYIFFILFFYQLLTNSLYEQGFYNNYDIFEVKGKIKVQKQSLFLNNNTKLQYKVNRKAIY